MGTTPRSVAPAGSLAVFAPFVGARSETFVRRHVCDLLPGRSVVVTDDATGYYSGHWTATGPLLALNRLPPLPKTERVFRALARRVAPRSGPSDIELTVTRFLTAHRVGVALGEFLSWSVPWLTVARKLDIPFFGHAHGFDVSADLRSPKWRQAYLAYNDSGGIITMSQASRLRLVELGIRPDKIHVVPYGVDVPEEPLERSEREAVGVLAVGRMTPKKAPIFVLDAFRRASAICPELRLDYVGEGELLSAARQFVHTFQMQDRVTLHGGQPSATVAALMRRADLFMQHSVTDPETGDEEGLPVAILEAMASSLPVVATRHAGIPEAVEEGVTGLLVNEGDTSQMADSLVSLARDARLRRSMGLAGWRVARERFTWHAERAALHEILAIGPTTLSATAERQSPLEARDELTRSVGAPGPSL